MAHWSQIVGHTGCSWFWLKLLTKKNLYLCRHSSRQAASCIVGHGCGWVLWRYSRNQILHLSTQIPRPAAIEWTKWIIFLTVAGSSGYLWWARNKELGPLLTDLLTDLNLRLVDSPTSPNSLLVGLDADWLIYIARLPYSDFSSRAQTLVANIISFNVNKLWDWLFPWEQSKSDDPWVLLELTRSRNFWVRQMGVASLANKKDWDSSRYRLVAQACDCHTLVALARYPHSNDGYFLPQPRLHPSKNSILQDLKDQLSRLPMPSSINSCLMFYRFISLDQDYLFQKDPLGMDFLTHAYPLPGEDEKKQEQAIGFCLEGLILYTSNAEYASLFVDNQGLPVLQRLLEQMPESWVQVYVATILSNLSQVPELLRDIVKTGWINVLRLWSKSSDAALALLALSTLANLDRDWISRDLYQDMVLLHPAYRNSQPVYADVVLVHGLKGGAVKTWRQRDITNSTQDQCPSGSCWPRDWLAVDCPNIRIISIGYNSSLHRWGDTCPYEQEKRTLEGRSKELMKKLKMAGVGARPIIWMGHSMGGLLIKNILSLGQQDSEFSQFPAQTKGVVFYSVPHHGSTVVDVLMYAKYLLFPSVEVQELHTSSPKLNTLHQDFIDFIKTNSVPCLSFGENAKSPVGRTLPKVLVVPLESSDPGVGKFVSVPEYHINTCKPCSKEDIIYQLTSSFIGDILKQIRR